VALTLIDSQTAQVFHVVDELSGWYPRADPAYVAWAKKEMPLDDAERAMLEKHAKLRAKRRWGGLDQAFEVNQPIADAVRSAVDKKLLTAADGDDERALLDHFSERVAPLLASRKTAIDAFEASLASQLPRLLPPLAQLGRFCEITDTIAVRAVLVPSAAAEAGGREGRATRTSIVVEIPTGGDAVPAFLHHLAHAILLHRRGTIALATANSAKCAEPVDDATLEEGFAYAFAPGLVGAGEGDALRDLVERDRAGSLADPRVRAERLGLAMRTALSAALEGGHETISSFLPKACEAWANVAKP
jgi:hypothetical protein